jgi:mannonate dehydratase
MPVLDWTRTDLRSPLPGGGRALRFDAAEFAAFDCFMLERPGAEADHPPEVLPRARAWFDASSEADRRRLLGNIMAGLPGAFDRYDVPGLRRMLDRYRGTTRDALRERLARFLRAVIPAAEEAGVRMCVHPDDPPRPTFGLPAIVSDADDLAFVVGAATPTPTASPSARARSAPAATTTSRPWRSGSRARSTSPTCATSPRSPTAPSRRPTTSAATSTWCRS